MTVLTLRWKRTDVRQFQIHNQKNRSLEESELARTLLNREVFIIECSYRLNTDVSMLEGLCET